MTRQHLLPVNSTPLERAIGLALDREDQVAHGVEAMHAFKFQRPLLAGGDFGPWLLVEYGLGAIARFFETHEAAIDAGVPWSRKRGTPAAIAAAIAWLGHTAISVEHQFPRRRKWNRYQIGMGALPPLDKEVAHLNDAEFLAGLSDPARSVFRRGFHGYDVRALEFGKGRWGGAIWGASSGVAVAGGTTRWSHGRTHEVAVTLSAATMAALRLDVENGDPVTWDDIPWAAPGRTWAGVVDAVALRAYLFRLLPMHLAFYRPDGSLIGARRMVALVDGEGFSFTASFRTGFGDGAGEDVSTVRVLFGRSGPADAPYRLWLRPDDLTLATGDADVLRSNPAPLEITLAHTLRELITVTITEA